MNSVRHISVPSTETGHGSGDCMNSGFVVLSPDPLVRGEVVNAGAASGQLYLVAHGPDELLATVAASRPRAIVVDREASAADDLLRRLAELPGRTETTVFLVLRDTGQEAPPAADVVVLGSALRDALVLGDRAA